MTLCVTRSWAAGDNRIGLRDVGATDDAFTWADGAQHSGYTAWGASPTSDGAGCGFLSATLGTTCAVSRQYGMLVG